jgi:hypothetical protein
MGRSATRAVWIAVIAGFAAGILGMIGGYLHATGSFGDGERSANRKALAHVPDEFRMAALTGGRKGTAKDFRPSRQVGLIDADWAEEGERAPNGSDAIGSDTTGAALDTLLSYAGTTERGDNRGPAVERFLAHVGLGPGYAYCAAAVSYSLDAPPGRAAPILTRVRSATAQDFDTGISVDSDVVMKMGIAPQGWIHVYQKGQGPFGHNGFVQHWRGRCGRTIEANTSKGRFGNQRDGQGIWERRRCYNPESYFHLDVFTPVIYREREFPSGREANASETEFPGGAPDHIRGAPIETPLWDARPSRPQRQRDLRRPRLSFSPRFVESRAQSPHNGDLALHSAEPDLHSRDAYRRGKLLLRGA